MSLEIGAEFETFQVLEKTVKDYELNNFVNLVVRDTRSVRAASKRNQRKNYNPAIKYSDITFCCTYGGKKFKSISTGKRNYKTTKKACPFSLKLRATLDGQKLVVRELNTSHNHELTEEEFRLHPKQRKLDQKSQQEVMKMLEVAPNTKSLREKLAHLTGKSILIKDIHNIKTRLNGVKNNAEQLTSSFQSDQQIEYIPTSGFNESSAHNSIISSICKDNSNFVDGLEYSTSEQTNMIYTDSGINNGNINSANLNNLLNPLGTETFQYTNSNYDFNQTANLYSITLHPSEQEQPHTTVEQQIGQAPNFPKNSITSVNNSISNRMTENTNLPSQNLDNNCDILNRNYQWTLPETACSEMTIMQNNLDLNNVNQNYQSMCQNSCLLSTQTLNRKSFPTGKASFTNMAAAVNQADVAHGSEIETISGNYNKANIQEQNLFRHNDKVLKCDSVFELNSFNKMASTTTQPGQFHDMLKGLSWLFGKWREDKAGQGIYPTLKDFNYGEEAEFFPVAMKPMIEYRFYSFRPDDKFPLHRETGFIRLKPDSNQIAFMASHNLGLVEVQEGTYKGQELTVETTSLVRASFNKPPAVKKTRRKLKVEGNILEQVLEMETENTPLSEHLRIKMTKVQS